MVLIQNSESFWYSQFFKFGKFWVIVDLLSKDIFLLFVKIGITNCLPSKVKEDNINYFPMASFTSCLRKLKWVPDVVRILVGRALSWCCREDAYLTPKNTLNLTKACNLWFMNLKARWKAWCNNLVGSLKAVRGVSLKINFGCSFRKHNGGW